MGFIKLLYTCLVIFFERYREYNSCLILFLSFSELFPASNCAKEIGNLLSIWLGVSIFTPSPGYFCLLKIRISSTSFTILSGFSIFLSSSGIFLISSFKSLNPLLITLTNLLF